MHAGNQPSGDAERRWERFRTVFQERYPRLSLNLVWDPRLYADRKLEVLMAADSVPPVAAMRRQAEIPRLAYLQGALPLDPYITKSSIVKKSDYYEKVLAGHTLDGKLYVVPHDMTLFALFYNKDAFAQQGLKVTGRYLGLRRLAAGRRAPDPHRRGRGRRSAHAVRD